MKTIIAGSRSFKSYLFVRSVVKESGFDITEVVSGGAKGVDRLGEEYAKRHNIPVKRFNPDWSKGKGAGFARNWEMAFYANALIAVWDGESRGTKHMIDAAREVGLKVHIHTAPQ